MNKAFILSKVTIEFYEAVRAYEPLTATTFPCNSRGYTFQRCYRLEKDGKTIGRAIAAWALIDTEKHSLVRVNEFELGLETLAPLDIPPTRIAVPGNITTVGTYDVTYADTDQNNHMNNTRYPDIYANFLPLSGKRISDISISYINEAPAKDRLTVMMAEENGCYYFRTLRSDGKVNSEAMIRLADI
jgi:acyl-ACP thioesterase